MAGFCGDCLSKSYYYNQSPFSPDSELWKGTGPLSLAEDVPAPRKVLPERGWGLSRQHPADSFRLFNALLSFFIYLFFNEERWRACKHNLKEREQRRALLAAATAGGREN